MSNPERGGDRLVRLALTVTRLPRALPWKSPLLWLIVAVNVALIVLYIWSRRGGATDVRIEVTDDHYEAYVDGKLVKGGNFATHPRGGVGIRLPAANRLPSSAQPVGIDSVRVTDSHTGAVLFEDDFAGKPKKDWRILSGYWDVHSGVWGAQIGGHVTAGDKTWTDYQADFKLRNLEAVNLFVWMQDTGNFLEIDLSLIRTYRASVLLRQSGEADQRSSGTPFQLDRGQTIRAISATILRPYPAMLLLVLITTLFALAARSLSGTRLDRGLHSLGQRTLQSSNQLVLIAAGWTLLLLWYILYFVSDGMPHVPDSVLYVFQSKIFASFRLTAPAPPVRESFSIFQPHMDQVIDGRWFSHYPFGHPMFLAIGQLLHVPSLVPPILGAACVVLIYVIGRRLYSSTVGLLAAALLMFSPFFQMTASNYMSHNTAAFLLLACIASYAWQTKRRPAAMFASGICVGLLFNVRPLTAVAFMLPLGAFMAYEFVRMGNQRWARVPEYAAFAVGAIIMFGLYLLYNKGTTGQFFESAYAAQGTYSEDTFGFGGAHSVAFGLQNEKQLLTLLLLVANGWPASIGIGIAALPFLLGTRHRWDYFLGASFLALASSNILYRNAAVMNGPRFWYETMPFLMLLTARGAIYLRDAAVTASDWIGSRMSARTRAPPTAITGTAVLCLMTGLIVFSASGWMLQLRDGWTSPFTPTNIGGLRGFNFSDDRLLNRADDMQLHNALVLVQQCSGWWCFGSEFWTNSPTLDNNVVWAEQQEDYDDIDLLKHYPDRKLYLANYDKGTIEPVTADQITNMALGPADRTSS